MINVKRIEKEDSKESATYGDIIETTCGSYYWLVEDAIGDDILVDIETGEASSNRVDRYLFVGECTPDDEIVAKIHKSQNITVSF